MKPSIREKLDQLTRRLEEVDALLSSEEAAKDMDQFRKLSKERAELEPVVSLYGAFRQAEADLAAAGLGVVEQLLHRLQPDILDQARMLQAGRFQRDRRQGQDVEGIARLVIPGPTLFHVGS